MRDCKPDCQPGIHRMEDRSPDFHACPPEATPRILTRSRDHSPDSGSIHGADHFLICLVANSLYSGSALGLLAKLGSQQSLLAAARAYEEAAC